MNKLHHSTADWDYEPGHRYYLDVNQFITPPSSLAFPLDNTGFQWPYCYLKEVIDPCIPNGRFITYWHIANVMFAFEMYFRQQTPLVHRGDQNGYRVRLRPTIGSWYIDRYTGGGGATVSTLGLPTINPDTWYRIRLDFYEYTNPGFPPYLRVELFIEQDGAWTSYGYWDDPLPLFSASAVNRLGFAPKEDTINRRTFIDNTEVWKIA